MSISSSASVPFTNALEQQWYREAVFLKTVTLNSWVLHKPDKPKRNEKQIQALLLDDVREVFFGGSCGGGKSDWLLMEALKYVDVPSYRAVIFRKTLQDLSLPGALLNRSKEWLMGTEAVWSDK